MHAHPTISAWQREEDGSYAAELHGAKLRVVWQPDGAEGPHGFWFEVTREGGEPVKSSLSWEEIEVAMAEAERWASGGA